ncbi:hypothetical protein BaRGS_00025314 [Batillaria attramentaria]|uniref:Uncharacterized protein n=1 Tax=Batillaria attramentaria TaxID=370345 RepID=A0ABD0K8G8_9CAEN
MTGSTLSSYINSDQLALGNDQTWLYSALLVAVIVGGMRTTRRGMLQLLQVCAGELWGKMLGLAPHHVLAATLNVKLPAGVRHQLRVIHRWCLRVLMGRKAYVVPRRTAPKTKHSLKHGKKRLNRTVSSTEVQILFTSVYSSVVRTRSEDEQSVIQALAAT